ncbi:MAG: hypothetical protein LBW85_09575, partial [Deltaproteobacteria bacterium]|nr:hypothetical protein [Deltaproteobacteria bacterium]
MKNSEDRTVRAFLAGGRALCAALAALIIVTGCAGQKLGKQTVVVKHYPTCYQPVTDMRRNAEQLNESVMKGAVGGAVTGAIAGLITGGGDWRHIAAGAAIGAISGATVSYLVTSETQSKAQAERFAMYTQTIDVDYRNLDQAVAAARITAQCYKQEYKKVERDFKAGRMSKEEMLERVAEIRDGSKDAATILRNYNDVAVANIQTYDEIVKAETTRTADRPSQSTMRRVTTKVATVKKTQSEAA